MSRNKNKRRKVSKRNNDPIPIIEQPSAVKLSFWQKILKKSNRVYIIFGAIFTIIGWWYLVKDNVKKEFQSDHDKWMEEKFIKGILLPDYLRDQDSVIVFTFAGFSYETKINRLINDVPTYPFDIKCLEGEKQPFHIGVKIKDNRVLVSADFKDIQKFEVVGSITDNRWSLFKDNLLNYQDTDSSLVVWDRGGYTILSLKFERPNIINLKGYFITSKNIAVIGDGQDVGMNACNPLSAKNEVISTIEKIKP